MNWRAVLERLRAAVFPDAEAAAVVDAAERMTVDGMSRRSFLRAGLLAATVAATVDVEQLLWTPGEKTLFLPTLEEIGAYGHNYPINPDWVTREALRILTNNLQMAGRFTQEYGDRFDRRSRRVGDTVTVRLPVRFEPIGDAFSGAIVLPTIDVTLDHQCGIEFDPPTAADEKHPARYIQRTLEPAMHNMAVRLQRAHVDTFADLPAPAGATIASGHGLSIRGIGDSSRNRVRIEVLGGASSGPRRRA